MSDTGKLLRIAGGHAWFQHTYLEIMALTDCLVQLFLDLLSLAAGFLTLGIGSKCMLPCSFGVGLHGLKCVVKPAYCSFSIRYLAIDPGNLVL